MKYTEALKLFVAENQFWPWMGRLFTIGDNIYGINGHMIAYIDKSMAENAPELQSDRVEAVLAVIPKQDNIDFTFPVSRIEKILNELPMVDEDTEKNCSDCDGSGEVEFEYNSIKGNLYEIDAECPICKGVGTLSRKTNNKVRDMSGVVRIDRHCFLLPTFDTVLRAAKILDVKEVQLVFIGAKHSVSVFKLGKMTVLIMPANMESDEETPKIVDVIEIT